MRKTYWGYILLFFLAAGVIGGLQDNKTSREWNNWLVGAIAFGVPGILLTRSGLDTDNKVKRFTDVYYTLKNQNDVVSSLELQKRAGLSAADVYKSKTIAEKRGLLPYGSELS